MAEDAVGTVVVSLKAWWSPPQRRSQDTCSRLGADLVERLANNRSLPADGPWFHYPTLAWIGAGASRSDVSRETTMDCCYHSNWEHLGRRSGMEVRAGVEIDALATSIQ